MGTISFLNPEFFWLFVLLPFAVFWLFYKKKEQTATLRMSSVKGFKNATSLRSKFKPYLPVLRIIALASMIIALARPRTVDISNQTKTTKGVDIVMAIDLSSSMLAKDLKPNRMEALKEVAIKFVENRPNDRIGIVAYAGEAYTKTPVTSDKAIVAEAIKDIKFDNVIQDGTAIGMGLSTAVNRLKDSKAKSKVIILLTDGVNNSGFIEPEMASQIAKEFKIKVYTIGIGSNGMADFPYAIAPNGSFIFKKMKVEIDEQLMKNIANNSGGKYFRATSNSKLETIYEEINKLETTEIEELKFYDYDEKFRPFLWIAIILLVIEIALRNTVFKSFI
jgi:Ca-activated chloride channel family protein